MKYTSALVASAGGSVGGATASHNRYGLYFRARAVPVNPNTTFQQDVRNLFATYASRWTEVLNQAQRDGWDTYALNTNGTTGLNAYVAANSARAQAGLTTIDVPPIIFAAATFTQVSGPIADDQSGDLTFSNTDEWAGEVGGALILSVSRPFSPSINFFKGPYRFTDKILGAVVPPTSPFGFTVPFTVATGQKVGVHVRVVRADGRISVPQRYTVVVS